jgi:calcineurin-like phosphoesterase
MNIFKTPALVATVLAASTSLATAQDEHSGHGTAHQTDAGATASARQI